MAGADSARREPVVVQRARPAIRAMQPYQPGKPVEELERELGVRDAIKMASNENPRGPAAGVRAAVAEAAFDLSRYPDGNGFRLKRRLAQTLGVEPSQLTLGNGSNDVLELLARVFVGPDDEGIVDAHCFVVYPLAIAAAGGKLVRTPSRHWGHDLDAMLEALTERTRIIFVANPNNPTATWHGRAAIERFLASVPADVLVVLDEAYFEYARAAVADYPDGLELLERFPNLVVTRTFSKIHGLAGLRVGYAVSHPAIADLVNRLRQPFNVSTVAQAGAEAALAETAYIEESIRLNTAGLEQLTASMRARGIAFIPSAANFLTIDVGEDAAGVYEALLREGVIVRPLRGYEMPRHLRVTTGTEAENARFVAALDRVLERGSSGGGDHRTDRRGES